MWRVSWGEAELVAGRPVARSLKRYVVSLSRDWNGQNKTQELFGRQKTQNSEVVEPKILSFTQRKLPPLPTSVRNLRLEG